MNQAEPRLPEVVRQIGLVTQKSSPDLTMVVFLTSPDGRYDSLYLRNYAVIQVRDVLARLPGMGDVRVFGSGDYAMRLWLDPGKIAAREMTVDDVLDAVREQNAEVAAGRIGGQPALPGTEFSYIVNAQGRLQTEEEFGDIVIKTGDRGRRRIPARRRAHRARPGDLCAAQHARRLTRRRPSRSSSCPGRTRSSYPTRCARRWRELRAAFPTAWVRDRLRPDGFVRSSIEAVVDTLFEAIALVVLVVVVFLQTWRASVVPLVAVPVAIIGTLAVLLLFGFSINSLTLFGLVLATGIVVDDAIVVVENIERKIEDGIERAQPRMPRWRRSPGPIISILLVLCSVFVPVAFLGGIEGQFYRQFAITIAVSTLISTFNSLTLSPALAALLLQPKHARPDAFQRVIDRVLGGFFRRFNRVFQCMSHATVRVRTWRRWRRGILLVFARACSPARG